MTPKIAVIIGTRPCIIKMWSPYIHLKANPLLDTILIHSKQHDALAVQAQGSFGLTPDFICRVEEPDRVRLGDLVSKLIAEFTLLFYGIKPNLVLVHGDTTTAFAAAEAAFLQNIPIGHIEAGLRTSRFETPWPEEGYRRQISRITTLHFAPTSRSAQNLREENINNNIFVTGNPIVDSLKHTLAKPDSLPFSIFREINGSRKIVLVTCHRRESYDEPLANLCRAIETLACRNPEVLFIWPVHSNPKIKTTVHLFMSSTSGCIRLIDPMCYEDFIKYLSISDIVITDSGGVMEETAVLGIPTLVLRTETERPEALTVDNILLMGYNFPNIIDKCSDWLQHPPRSKFKHNNVFGDGTAGQEISEIVGEYFDVYI